MWIELAILLVIPYPVIRQPFTIPTVNWNGGDANAGTVVYYTQYLSHDVIFSFMMLRFLFVIQAAMALSPSDSIQFRKICGSHGIESSVWLQLKSNLIQYPLRSVLLL